MNKNLRYSLLKMLFNRKFLKELQKRLNGSDSYLMTKYSVKLLLKSEILQETDKNVIFDAIRNDVYCNEDPLSLRKLWNERIKDPKLRFE
jgi:hypothetical protein